MKMLLWKCFLDVINILKSKRWVKQEDYPPQCRWISSNHLRNLRTENEVTPKKRNSASNVQHRNSDQDYSCLSCQACRCTHSPYSDMTQSLNSLPCTHTHTCTWHIYTVPYWLNFWRILIYYPCSFCVQHIPISSISLAAPAGTLTIHGVLQRNSSPHQAHHTRSSLGQNHGQGVNPTPLSSCLVPGNCHHQVRVEKLWAHLDKKRPFFPRLLPPDFATTARWKHGTASCFSTLPGAAQVDTPRMEIRPGIWHWMPGTLSSYLTHGGCDGVRDCEEAAWWGG